MILILADEWTVFLSAHIVLGFCDSHILPVEVIEVNVMSHIIRFVLLHLFLPHLVHLLIVFLAALGVPFPLPHYVITDWVSVKTRNIQREREIGEGEQGKGYIKNNYFLHDLT